MKLYARYLSPFGRRVAIWLGLQGVAFQQIEIAPVPQFDELLRINPLGRVPVLELDDGRRLVDSTMICDHLETVSTPENRLIPKQPDARLATTQYMARAHGLTEKGVALFYETGRRPAEFQWPAWGERLTRQVQGGLAELEAQSPPGGFLGGDRPNGADILAVVAYDFLTVTQQGALDGQPLAEIAPRLAGLSGLANRLAPFAATQPQPG